MLALGDDRFLSVGGEAMGVWLRRLVERGFKSTGGGGWTMGVLRGDNGGGADGGGY